MKFVDIKNDVAFRKIFGNEKKTEILISFLNAVLHLDDNLDDEGLKEAYADANRNTWSKAELDAYNYAAMREQDERGRIAKAEQKAEQKGAEKKEIEAVMGMNENGIAILIIAQSLKISVERVQEIIENYKKS
jgi:flagellar biosynthesis/type III secretory pathway protein FliH